MAREAEIGSHNVIIHFHLPVFSKHASTAVMAIAQVDIEFSVEDIQVVLPNIITKIDVIAVFQFMVLFFNSMTILTANIL